MDLCASVNLLAALLVQGPVVALLVELAKRRLAFVRDNPKRAAAILNGLAALLVGVGVCGVDIGAILSVFVSGFAGSVATYETAVKPLRETNDETPPASGAGSTGPEPRLRL